MAINSGTLKTSGVAQGTTQTHGSGGLDTAANIGQFADNRRIHDFGDRVAELTPEESPFFVYLSKVAKRATTDPVFRFMENRSKIDWTSRNFFSAGSTITAATEGSVSSVYVDDNSAATGSGNYIPWLVKGMVVAANTVDAGQALFRIESVDNSNTAKTLLSLKTISVSSTTDADDLADNDEFQVVGSSFEEGSGSPDTWSSELDDDFGYTQIFKTAAEMSNTAIATNYRGYANEWNRIWALKLREHKVDIERAMLYGQKARVGGIAYTEGIIGMILKGATFKDSSSAYAKISYNSGAPYGQKIAKAFFTYDNLMSDFEVFFDPARGGSSSKLALASLPVLTYLNQLGGFADKSLHEGGFEDVASYSLRTTERGGAFGHRILDIETIHGNMSVVKEPLFRGIGAEHLALIDLGQVAYRPLVGNGLNRDTHIITNVQQADEDLRKDMIVTEAGLEVTLPETHMLYAFTDLVS